MKIRIYQVDAFVTEKPFSGNPAAVCPLDSWLPESTMQDIAAENNLAETAFYVKEGDLYHIRWFTPATEVDLCGHATLAASYVIFTYDNFPGTELVFTSRSGKLTVTRSGEQLTLNFPSDIPFRTDSPAGLAEGLKRTPLEVYKGKTDYMAVYASEDDVLALSPDFKALSVIEARGVIATARGSSADFVSRFFAPQSGIDEDPVTGSAHTTLTPFWAERLDKKEFRAIQQSKRQGLLNCRLDGDRVELTGRVKTYLTGEIEV